MKNTRSKGKKRAKWKDEQVPVAPQDTASSKSGTASASSSSDGLRDFEDAVWEAMGSTSNSTAAMEARLKAERKVLRKGRRVDRSFSKTMYPDVTSSDSSSSVNSKGARCGLSICNSAFVYPAVAIIVTTLVTGIIVAAMRREGAYANEPLRTALPKKATSSLTECPCNDGADSTPAEPEEDVDSEQPDTVRHRPTTRRRRHSSVEHSTALRRGETPGGVRTATATNSSEAMSPPGSSERASSNGEMTTKPATEGNRYNTATRSHRRRRGSGSTRRRRRVDSTTAATTLEETYRTTTVDDTQSSEWAARDKERIAAADARSTTGDRIKNGKASSFERAPVTKQGNVSTSSRVELPTERGAGTDVRPHQRDADGTTRGKRHSKRRKRSRRSKTISVT